MEDGGAPKRLPDGAQSQPKKFHRKRSKKRFGRNARKGAKQKTSTARPDAVVVPAVVILRPQQ